MFNDILNRAKTFNEASTDDIVTPSADDDGVNESGQSGAFFDVPLSESISPEMLSEAAIMLLIEAVEAMNVEQVKQFIKENSHEFIRDGILSESAIRNSFMVLDHESRRKKAENLLKLQMARKANDPRYLKAMALRRRYITLIEEIRRDSRYSSAHAEVMKKQFHSRVAPKASALAARATQQASRLY